MSVCEHRCYCFYKSPTVPSQLRTQYACLRSVMLKNELRNYPTQKPPEECHYSFATSKSFRGAQMLYFGGDIRLSQPFWLLLPYPPCELVSPHMCLSVLMYSLYISCVFVCKWTYIARYVKETLVCMGPEAERWECIISAQALISFTADLCSHSIQLKFIQFHYILFLSVETYSAIFIHFYFCYQLSVCNSKKCCCFYM